MDLSVVRIVFDFYPVKGGSVSHVIELTEKINPHLARQILIAPAFKGDYTDFDREFIIPVYRVGYHRYPWLRRHNTSPGTPHASDGYTDTIFSMYLSRLSYVRNVVRLLRELAGQGHPIDIVHVHDFLAGLLAVLLFKLYRVKIPVVFMHHGGIKKPAGLRSSAGNNIYLGMLNCLRPAHFIILEDGTNTGLYLDFLKRKNIPGTTVYHGIDTDYFSPAKAVADTDFVVLSAHRLDDFKRVDFAIDGFRKFSDLAGNPKNARLLIAGGGPLSADLADQVRKLDLADRVQFLGEQNLSGVKELLAISSVAVGTSLVSNMNRSIEEAMACEVPVVAFGSGGTGSLIRHMHNGLVANPGDTDDLALKLKTLYDDPDLRKQLGHNARQTILHHLNWEARIRAELAVYEEVSGTAKPLAAPVTYTG